MGLRGEMRKQGRNGVRKILRCWGASGAQSELTISEWARWVPHFMSYVSVSKIRFLLNDPMELVL